MERTEPATQSANKKFRFRFGLRLLLLLAMLIAIFLGAYEYGRRTGFDAGNRSGFAAGLQAKVYPKAYRVSDLVLPAPTVGMADFQSLMDEIQREVQPTSWEVSGGPATLAPYPLNLSLVVSQTERGHDELQDYLAAKRDRASRK